MRAFVRRSSGPPTRETGRRGAPLAILVTYHERPVLEHEIRVARVIHDGTSIKGLCLLEDRVGDLWGLFTGCHIGEQSSCPKQKKRQYHGHFVLVKIRHQSPTNIFCILCMKYVVKLKLKLKRLNKGAKSL